VALQRPSLAVPIWEAVTRGCLNSYSKSDALGCANLLLQRAPDHAGGLLLRGKALESLKRDEGALHDYRRAVELDPAGDEARLRLAALYARLGRPWQALPHYQCLAEGQPDNREVLLGLARCHYDLHALKEARLTLNRLIDRHPDYVPALVQRGRWDFHAGRTAEAESALRRATELDARDHDAHITLCQCLETQGKEKEAQLFQARLRRLEDDNTRVRVLIDWSRHHPHDAPLRYEIGTRLVALGRDEDAASWFFAALGEDAHYAPAHTALAEYFEHTGRPFRAARQRRAAQDPGR
jgi:tetratricopeptide (TPR) repeat protein